ncbi:hypothetical protein [Halomarina pelagica]|uniref:hypothetical protein n=1 Tax=Halomarina pelagica TaxID=2961599 RepID=UPI0020C1D4CD|nr:hypothetical protein [Halomarina sp. BND7]
MTPGETSLTSKEELNAELIALLRRAYENGINVEGGWECRNGVEHPDWDVIITEVSKSEEST